MNPVESFFTLNEETRIFLASCLLGIPFGIFFDVFRTIRIVIPHNGKIGVYITALEDVIYFFICSIIMLCFMSVFVKGQFRFIYCFGAIWGFAIYYCSVGGIVVGFFRKVAEFLRKIRLKISFFNKKK